MFHTGSNPEGSLSVVVNSANNMKDIEAVGKQDPYLQFSLDLNDKSAWQRTFVQKDAGQDASWNQSFQVRLRGEPDLFVEVLDEEKGVDEVIGFCTIPIAQVVQSAGGFMNGVFGLYNIKGENNGTLHLTLTARGFNSPPGYAQPSQPQPVTGRSYVNDEHLKRVKSMHHKALAGDVGTSILGGALALGAGFLANKLYQDHNRKEQEERDQYEHEKQEAERQRLQQQQQYQHQQQQQYQHQQQYEHQQQQQQQQQYHHSGGHGKKKKERRGSGSSSSSSSSDDEYKKKNKHGRRGSAWNPVGTYQPGDRVEYHGRTYICLQGHTSNPTWMPGAAHSLWQLS